jgi:gamma-glutamylcyclotransferase (GGCT)/AIG2-like uncharacterized protein YtfP
MSSLRLKSRCPSARFVSIAILKGFRLAFNKQSKKDGSGKANIVATQKNEDEVWGVIFDVSDNDKPELDKWEGLGKGYDEKALQVLSDKGQELTVQAYVANKTIDGIQPYDWYQRHCLIGATEFGLPQSYINMIESSKYSVDVDGKRRDDELAIYSGQASGIG